MVEQRHIIQACTVWTTGILAIGAAVLARRSVAARRYVPGLFSPNHIPPKINFVQDGVRAVGDASLLSTSAFGFVVASYAWLHDLSSFSEFGNYMRQKYPQTTLIGTDDETKDIEKSLLSWIGKN